MLFTDNSNFSLEVYVCLDGVDSPDLKHNF